MNAVTRHGGSARKATTSGPTPRGRRRGGGALGLAIDAEQLRVLAREADTHVAAA
jgi:hypothetical protein